MTLKGRHAVVTGGASGIGRAVCVLLVAEGACVTVVDRDEAAAQRVADELRANGGAAHALGADVADAASVASAVAAIVERQAIDILVNSAGIAATAAFLETSVELFDRMLAVNLRGTFLVCQAVARTMVARGAGGAIVNLGSASGERGNAGRAAYGTSKAGVALLTKIMAVELAVFGIRSNVVAPGPVETPLVAQAHDESVRRHWLAELPAGRYGTPREVAAAVLFLCSDDAAYVNGHVLHVDGGFWASGVLSH